MSFQLKLIKCVFGIFVMQMKYMGFFVKLVVFCDYDFIEKVLNGDYIFFL